MSKLGLLIPAQLAYMTSFDLCSKIIYQIWGENVLFMVKYVLMTLGCPLEMLDWYKVMILSKQISGIVKIVDSFPGVILSLKNSKYHSTNVLVLLTASFRRWYFIVYLIQIYILEVWTI